jgi:hypothetical protein
MLKDCVAFWHDFMSKSKTFKFGVGGIVVFFILALVMCSLN